MVDSKFDQYKVEHLFLLVGQNPLPNYVAAKLLLNEGGTVYLIHTSQTKEQTKRLKRILNDEKCGSIKNLSLGSSTSYPQDIIQKIAKYTKEASGRLGLNYTGGNKVMSVHAYRAFRNMENSDTVFSYLDSNNLKIQIEQSDYLLPLNIPLDVSLKTIFDLHGLELRIDFKKDLPLIELATSFATGEEDWKEFKPENRASLPEEKQKLFEYIQTEGKFANNKDCDKWINGGWLEDYALQQIIDIAQKFQIHDYGMNFEVLLGNGRTTDGHEDQFEFDVAFMRNHQLFALSCTTKGSKISHKKECKWKLFEAYVRAQQMGGSEARIALICGSEQPEALKEEMEVSIKDPKIKVFGRTDWPNLSNKISDWITELDHKTV